MSAPHAEIAGAGLGGLAAGIALRQRGWTVAIREQSAQLRDAGVAIYLSGNGLRVLDALGVQDTVRQGAMLPAAMTVMSGGVERSSRVINTDADNAVWAMTRQHLHACMLARAMALDVQVEAGASVVGAEPDGVIVLADGRRLQADLVVGADGVRSNVRAALPFQVTRELYDDGIIRLLAERRTPPAGAVDRVLDFFSPDATLPLRALVTPVAPGLIYLALMADYRAGRATAIPLDLDLWSSRFPEVFTGVDRLVGPARFDRYQMTCVDRWSIGSVALIGDAAHAMPPTLGQGAGFAMMNALAMAVFLQDGGDVPAALAAWEAHERPFTDKTQAKAVEVALLGQRRAEFHPMDPVAEAAAHIPTGTQ